MAACQTGPPPAGHPAAASTAARATGPGSWAGWGTGRAVRKRAGAPSRRRAPPTVGDCAAQRLPGLVAGGPGWQAPRQRRAAARCRGGGCGSTGQRSSGRALGWEGAPRSAATRTASGATWRPWCGSYYVAAAGLLGRCWQRPVGTACRAIGGPGGRGSAEV